MIQPAIAHKYVNVPDYYRQRRWLGYVTYMHVADNEVCKKNHSH